MREDGGDVQIPACAHSSEEQSTSRRRRRGEAIPNKPLVSPLSSSLPSLELPTTLHSCECIKNTGWKCSNFFTTTHHPIPSTTPPSQRNLVWDLAGGHNWFSRGAAVEKIETTFSTSSATALCSVLQWRLTFAQIVLIWA